MASPGNQHCAICIGTLSFPLDLLTFRSQGMDYTFTIYVFIHTYEENKIELGLLKIDEHKRQKGNFCNEYFACEVMYI